LLLGAGLAFRMRPDRPFETAATVPVTAPVAADHVASEEVLTDTIDAQSMMRRGCNVHP
jgi:hypothetical protein